MYKACIFDLDGTLVNTLDSIAYFSNSALTKCGYRSIEVPKYRYIVGNGADTQMHRMLDTVCKKDGYTEEDVQKLRKVYDELYESNPTFNVKNYNGIRETISALKDIGIKTAVLSNKPHNCTSAIVSSLFKQGSFDLYYGQRKNVPRKPSPQGALLIAKELGVQPKNCLYIGDTNTDMITGEAAGMDTAGVLWGFRDEKELKENNAKYIIESPKQIYEIIAFSMRC